jgi:hypothetical protein
MLTLMTLRCEQCAHENDSRYRFCGMCGAKLPLPVRETPAPRTNPPEPPARPVSGPSFLGLADEPADPVSYLLEDEASTSHRGRYLVLAVFLAGIAAASWHWRQDLGSFLSRFSGGPPASQSQETTSLAPAPAAALSSETQTSPGGTPLAVQQTGGGTSSQSVPATSPAASAPQPNPSAAPASDQAPTGESSANSAAPGGPSVPPGSQTLQPAAPPATASNGSRLASSNSKDENSTENHEGPREVTSAVKPGPTVKASRNSGDQFPSDSESDALEAQGEKYLYGNGVPTNCALSQKSLLAAAERSSAKAQSVLGTMYATGHCVVRDLPVAYRWFARALHQDPSNTRIEQDLKVLWSQMSPDERQLALRAAR